MLWSHGFLEWKNSEFEFCKILSFDPKISRNFRRNSNRTLGTDFRSFVYKILNPLVPLTEVLKHEALRNNFFKKKSTKIFIQMPNFRLFQKSLQNIIGNSKFVFAVTLTNKKNSHYETTHRQSTKNVRCDTNSRIRVFVKKNSVLSFGQNWT